jgi:hypothetical protein
MTYSGAFLRAVEAERRRMDKRLDRIDRDMERASASAKARLTAERRRVVAYRKWLGRLHTDS